jgi:hypothetical protein
VRHEHRGLPGAADHAPEQAAHRGGGVDVEGGERLVEQQQLRVRSQGAGQRHPLLLPTGHPRRTAVGQVGGVDVREQRAGQPLGLPARHAVRARPERDVGERGQVGEEQRLLGEQPHAAPVRRHVDARRGVRHRPVAHPDVPLVRPEQPSEHAEQRGLARTVGAEHGEHLARFGGERHVERERLAAHDDPGVDPGAHRSPSTVRGRATAITTTATTTSSSDSAIAASTSDSRSR